MTALVSWTVDTCRYPRPCDCRAGNYDRAEAYAPPASGIGGWNPCMKPGPCPCTDLCDWVRATLPPSELRQILEAKPGA
jgi:hypothetical protein